MHVQILTRTVLRKLQWEGLPTWISPLEDKLSKKFVPKNTASTTKWATGTLLTWMQNRNECFSDKLGKQGPHGLLESDSPELLSKWLKHFVAEA